MQTSETTTNSLGHYTAVADRYDHLYGAASAERPSRDASPAVASRPAWQRLLADVDVLGHDGLVRSAATIDQLIRENGTTFLAETDDDGKVEHRPWHLSTLPTVVDSADWAILTSGLQQRTRVLEAILADLLGPQRLVREGVVPSSLLWSNPRFHRAFTCLPQTGGLRLHITATDVVRDPAGTWVVTGDRTRAPSGLGYLLENRIITGRVHSRSMRRSDTRRLAAFFDRLRGHLHAMAPAQANPRVALLTPRADNYREFEDSYLARYLGITLVQGTDLAVRGGRVNLKTLGGLLPIDVLWRHVSDRNCDALELDPASTDGVTGLLRVVRAGRVAVLNAIGTSLVQSPAVLPFVPAAAKFLLGEDLKLPTNFTLWCGQRRECEQVLADLDAFLIRPAFRITNHPAIAPVELSASAKAELVDAIRARPHEFIAQRPTRHSTTPVWHEGGLQPWFTSLKCFQLQTSDGEVDVMPGALVRLSDREAELSRSSVGGRLTQDLWVISDKPVDHEATLLAPPSRQIKLTRAGDELPSRVAEHLFWMGRYAERAESIARLLRTTLTRIGSENDIGDVDELPRLVSALASVGQIEPGYALELFGGSLPTIDQSLPQSIFDPDQPRGLANAVRAILSNARAVRDRLTVDAFRMLQRSSRELNAATNDYNLGRLIDLLSQLIGNLLSFAGVANESFMRTGAWQFLELGRRIERADQTSELLIATLVQADDHERAIADAVMETTDSIMTYRSRYLNVMRVEAVLDLIVTDRTNPRSLRFQLDEIEAIVRALPDTGDGVGMSAEQKMVAELAHAVRMADPIALAAVGEANRREMLDALLSKLVDGLPTLSNAIAARYLIHTGVTQALTGVGS